MAVSDTPGIVSETDHKYDAIAGAARLATHCAGYLDDRVLEAEGWTVLYAVDVDVIKLFMAPEERYRYGTVFARAEGTDICTLVARLLGDFIFRKPEPSDGIRWRTRSLILIPPHDEELERLVFQLCDDLKRAGEAIERKSVLESIFPAGGKADVSSLATSLMKNAPELIGIFHGSGALSQLNRFESLADRGLVGLDRFSDKSGTWSFPNRRLREDHAESRQFAKTFAEWKKRLFDHKSYSQPHGSVLRDAHVLATVEWINSRIDLERRKLVLITGTTGILNAAKQYLVPAASGDRCFADLYIRHPQAFTADQNFFANDFNIVDWLNLLFPNAVREDSTTGRRATIDLKQVRQIASAVSSNFDEALGLLQSASSRQIDSPAPQSIVDEWKAQIRAASVSHGIDQATLGPSETSAEFVRWLSNRIGAGDPLPKLKEELSSRIDKSLSSLYSSTTWLGLWSNAEIDSDRVRGIPALRFDEDFEEARDYCSRVVTAMRSRTREGLDIAEMYSRLAEEDPTHYHAHVIHALAYATKGHWYAARTLCGLALRTADSIPVPRGRCQGREAAYLLAVAERRLAPNAEHLKVAHDMLQQAIKREDPGKPLDIRFQSEEFALRIAHLNFAVFMQDGDASGFQSELDRFLAEGSELIDKANLDTLKSAKHWVRQQTTTNLLNLALIANREHLAIPPLSMNHVRKALSIAAEESQSEEGNWDDVCQFMYLAASAVFGQQANNRHEARRALSRLRFPLYLPFDELREAAFRQLAGRND